MSALSEIFELKGTLPKRLTKVNLLFIFVFLNVWDFAVNRTFFNGMAIGIIMFGPSVFFWFIGNLRAIVLLTLISIFEFMVMLVFVLEGFELGGTATTLKSIFWVPYLIMAGANGFIGLKIYSEYKESFQKEDSLRFSSAERGASLKEKKGRK